MQAQTPLVSRAMVGGRSTQPHHADMLQPDQAISTANLKERNQYGGRHAAQTTLHVKNNSNLNLHAISSNIKSEGRRPQHQLVGLGSLSRQPRE